MVIEFVIKNGVRLKSEKYRYSEIKKGYEVTKDQYIVLEKADLDKIKLKTTNTIDIKEFVARKGA